MHKFVQLITTYLRKLTAYFKAYDTKALKVYTRVRYREVLADMK